MTPKQMYRAMRKWGISLVFVKADEAWYAGEEFALANRSPCWQFGVSALNPTSSGLLHKGSNPEDAVADYCNARNLEWDV